MAHEDLIGHEFAPYTMPVERGKVIEFARSVLATDPVHLDKDAARRQGYADVVAPLTFSAVTSHWAPPPGPDGDDLDIDLRRILAGGAQWTYFEPIVAGDELTVSARIVSVEHKTGRRGGMTLITREVSFTNQRGELAMTLHSTMIELDSAPSDREGAQ